MARRTSYRSSPRDARLGWSHRSLRTAIAPQRTRAIAPRVIAATPAGMAWWLGIDEKNPLIHRWSE